MSITATGTLTAGRNLAARPRVRGPWVVIILSSTNAWAYEALTLVVQKLGRLR